MDEEYEHGAVNHAKREYARGNVHVNSCEGYNSLLRPWLRRFRGVAKKNLYLYAKAFELVETEKDVVRRFMKVVEFLRTIFSEIGFGQQIL